MQLKKLIFSTFYVKFMEKQHKNHLVEISLKFSNFIEFVNLLYLHGLKCNGHKINFKLSMFGLQRIPPL